jgi:hypothetical protein
MSIGRLSMSIESSRRGSRHASVCSVALALALACAAGTAAAQTRRDPRFTTSQFTGTYRYAGTPEEGDAIIRGAFEEAIDQVTPILRPFIRKAMGDRDYLVRSITITATPGRISFRAVSYKVFSITTEPGVPRTVTSRRGRETRVTQRFVGRQLEQVLESSRGEQRNLLTLVDGGRALVAHTTFTSRFLDRPVSFDLRYDRVAPVRRPDRNDRLRNRRTRRVRPRRRPPVRRSVTIAPLRLVVPRPVLADPAPATGGATPVQTDAAPLPVEPAPTPVEPAPVEPTPTPVEPAPVEPAEGGA